VVRAIVLAVDVKQIQMRVAPAEGLERNACVRPGSRKPRTPRRKSPRGIRRSRSRVAWWMFSARLFSRAASLTNTCFTIRCDRPNNLTTPFAHRFTEGGDLAHVGYPVAPATRREKFQWWRNDVLLILVIEDAPEISDGTLRVPSNPVVPIFGIVDARRQERYE
jgi:hypothetical protein